jgi:hypothetical protein
LAHDFDVAMGHVKEPTRIARLLIRGDQLEYGIYIPSPSHQRRNLHRITHHFLNLNAERISKVSQKFAPNWAIPLGLAHRPLRDTGSQRQLQLG